MNKNESIQQQSGGGIQWASALMMCMCLFQYTCPHFIKHPPNGKHMLNTDNHAVSDENEVPNQAKVHVKLNLGINLQEEFLQLKKASKNISWFSTMLHNRIIELEKLQIVTGERVYPPPKFC
jgi:hypothetical protein